MKSLVDKFLQFEKTEKLFDFAVDKVMIWDYVRVKVYSAIKKKNLDIKYTKNSLRQKPIKSLLNVFRQYVFVLFSLKRFLIKGRKDILILGHPRRQKNGKFYEDIYTDILVENLREKHTVCSLELPLSQSHLRPINMDEVKYLDLLELGQTFSPYFRRSRISVEEKIKIQYIEDKIFLEFGIKINLLKLIKVHVIQYHYTYRKINNIIHRISPKIIITVDGYNFTKKIFIEIANKKNTPTIELQHGTIGSEHIGYNYPNGSNPNSFPRCFFAWGKLWHQNTRFPSLTKIYDLGFPHMEKQRNKMNLLNQQETNILVSSQWTIGFELMDYINQFAKNMSEHNFIVKLHPLEFDALDAYKKLALNRNISFVTDEKSIYELFFMCKTHIGVYSTTLTEGLAFNLRTLIVPLNGYEMYFDMIQRGYMHTAQSSDELYNLLKNETAINRSEEIWVYHPLDNIKKKIEEMIC